MATKIYAVKAGRKTGIFYTWEECNEQVSGFAGAVYKTFRSEHAAQVWLGTDEASGQEQVARRDLLADTVGTVIYTDGAYRDGIYSWAYVVLRDGKLVREHAGVGKSPSAAEIHNVAGELSAVMRAVTYAAKHDLLPATIHHDFEGVAHWLQGDWRAKNPLIIDYVMFMRKFVSDLRFVHVWGHSGNRWNERCDELAKRALTLG